MIEFKANGKLMLTGEYLVLKGAKSLALPTVQGQKMRVEYTTDKYIHWSSLVQGNHWFNARLNKDTFQIMATNIETVAETLSKTLGYVRELKPDFVLNTGVNITTSTDFNPAWGLGSSSSFIANVASWTGCDPFDLNYAIFKGSGYDIACALHNRPLIYQITDHLPSIQEVDFNPPFKAQLYFIWLNRKQNTRDGIGQIDSEKNFMTEIHELDALTFAAIESASLTDFQKILFEHERLISHVVHAPTVQEKLFADFPGQIKSLGAWGGDFVMAATEHSSEFVKKYFNQKGFNTVLSFKDLFKF